MMEKVGEKFFDRLKHGASQSIKKVGCRGATPNSSKGVAMWCL